MRLHTTSSSRSFLLVMCLSMVSDPVSEEVSSSWSLHTNKLKNNSGINNLYCNKIRQDEKWIFSPRMVYLLAFRPQLFSIQWITKLVFQIPIQLDSGAILLLNSSALRYIYKRKKSRMFKWTENKCWYLKNLRLFFFSTAGENICLEYETFRTVLGPSCFSVTCACVLNCTGIRLWSSEHAIKLNIIPLSRKYSRSV